MDFLMGAMRKSEREEMKRVLNALQSALIVGNTFVAKQHVATAIFIMKMVEPAKRAD